MFANRIISK